MFNQATAPGWFLRPDLWPYYMPHVRTLLWQEEQDATQNPSAPTYPLAPISGLDSQDLFYGTLPGNSAAASFLNLLSPPTATLANNAPALGSNAFNLDAPGMAPPSWLDAALFGLNGTHPGTRADNRELAGADDARPQPFNPFSDAPAYSEEPSTHQDAGDDASSNSALIDPDTLDDWQWGPPPSTGPSFDFSSAGAPPWRTPWSPVPMPSLLPGNAQAGFGARVNWNPVPMPGTLNSSLIPGRRPFGIQPQDSGTNDSAIDEQEPDIASDAEDGTGEERSPPLHGAAEYDSDSEEPAASTEGADAEDFSAARRPPKHQAPHRAKPQEKRAKPSKKEKKEPQKQEPPTRREPREERRSIPDDAPTGATLTGRELGDYQNKNQLRSRALDFAQKYLSNRVVVNTETGFSIKINWSGLKHTTAQNRPDEEFLAVAALPDLIANAKYVRAEPDYHRPARKEIKAVHIFRSAVEIAGKRFPVRMIVRETKEGKFFYDLHKDPLLE